MHRSLRSQTALLSLALSLTLTPATSNLLAQQDPSHPTTAKKAKQAKEKILHAITPGRKMADADDDDNEFGGAAEIAKPVKPVVNRNPRQEKLVRGHAFNGDLRTLPQTPMLVKRERPEHSDPKITPKIYPGASSTASSQAAVKSVAPSAPAPAATLDFDGLDFATWGAGHPLDQNGDVGPTYYIQTVNTSIGIFDKTTGTRVTAFTFNTFMSQGSFGNLCDTNNFGDPVVLYDSFEDRWVITDFAFNLDGSGNVSPQHVYQCFAVSKNGDPVSGGWNYYSVETVGGLGDYPKFGIWPDGLYWSANIFGYAASGSFQNPRVWALNKQQMYAGAPTVQVVSFDAPSADFTLLPSDARLQTGTPPTGTPNYFVSTYDYLNALTVYKLHVDWNDISLSTFSGPDTPLASTSWPNASVPNAPTPANALDVLQLRAMARNQYSNIGGVESLWATHTVRRASTTGFAAPRWYQVDVTGGSVAANLPQAATWDPDGTNTNYRYMPSVAVDRVGDMAMGYSLSNATTNPSIRYAGRLATDPINTFSLGEQTLINGTGSQSGNCGSSACIRWGDYSSMSLDPDGCTFWYTNGYFATNGLNVLTRIGKFSFPSCTAAGTGTISGTVTNAGTSTPINGATVQLGSRSTTTDVNGAYSFSGLATGTYPSIVASYPGFTSASANELSVTDGGVTTQNFTLSTAAASGCLTDTTQADFQAGVASSNCDLTGSPGDVSLLKFNGVDQQNTTLTSSGVAVTNTTWNGQTFTPSVSGQITRVDLNLFCASCSGANPDWTVSIRATSSGLPTGSDLGAATISGFNSGSSAWYTANFATPVSVTAGTPYVVIFHSNAARTGTYAATYGSNPFAGGNRVNSTNSGISWTTDTTRDFGFKIYVATTSYPSSGTYTSSVKDSNPLSNSTAHWGTISWNADVPANTGITFQVAASNSSTGPFTFVGSDGTNATTFSNGGDLSQFNGKRYLKYQATFASDTSTTPSLHDVTICFNDVPNVTSTTLTVSPASGTYNGTVDLSATLSASGSGVSGETVDFTLNGTGVGSGTTDSNGVATVTSVSLAGITAGSYPGAVAANFGGDSTYGTTSGSADLTVTKADQTINFGSLSNKTYGDADFAVFATATSGLSVTFSTSGNCSIAGSTAKPVRNVVPVGAMIHIDHAGSCTVTASQTGDTNYNSAVDVPRTFNIGQATPVLTWSNPANISLGTALSATQLNASANTAGTYDYNPPSGTVLGLGPHTLSVTFNPTDSTDYVSTGTSVSITVDPGVAVLSSPADGSTFSSGSQSFTWNNTGASRYVLTIGTTKGGTDVYNQTFPGTTTSANVTGLPQFGQPVYVTLYSYVSGAWPRNAYTFTEAGSPSIATMASPSAGSTLTGASQTFTWNPGVGPTRYVLTVGTTAGGTDIYNQTFPAGTTSANVTGIPTNGVDVYVTIYSYVKGSWPRNQYTYREAGSATPASMISPTPGSTLSGASQTFTWNPGVGATRYVLTVGTSPGGTDLYNQPFAAGTTSATVNGLPTNGAKIYVTLYSYIDAAWPRNPYTYVTGP